MEKNIIEHSLDTFFSEKFSNYSSEKERLNNDLSCSFYIDDKLVKTSIFYCTSTNILLTNEDNESNYEFETTISQEILEEFEISIYKDYDINKFLIQIGQQKHINIVNEINNFFEEAGITVSHIKCIFSGSFELIRVSIHEKTLNLEELNNQEITVDFLRDKFIADYIYKNSSLMHYTSELHTDKCKDEGYNSKYYIEIFNNLGIRYLYVKENNTIKMAAKTLTSRLKNNHINLGEKLDNFKSLMLKTYTQIFNYKFNISSDYNKITTDFDILFNVSFDMKKEVDVNALNYLLNSSDNYIMMNTIQEIENSIKPLKIDIHHICLYFSPNFIIQKVDFNHSVLIDNDNIKSYTYKINELLFVKFFNRYHQNILYSQHLETLNNLLTEEDNPEWTKIVDEFNKHKDNLLMLVKMSTI